MCKGSSVMNRKIKIIHIVNDFSVGGVSKIVLDLCTQRNFEAFEINIISLGMNNDILQNNQLPDDIKCYFFNYSFPTSYSLISHFKHAFLPILTKNKSQEILDLIISINPDILHFHTLPRELMIGILAKRKIKSELIYTDHSSRLNPGEYNFFIISTLSLIYRKLYRNFHLIPVSQNGERIIRTLSLLGKRKKLQLIKNQIPIKAVKKDKIPQDSSLNVVYVSRICNGKGHEELLHSWVSIQNKEKYKLFIIGPDSTNGNIEKLAKELNILQSVTFTGFQDDIISWLEKADIGVFPSHKEGLPLALLEKMAAGLPVIVADIPELKDIIKNNENGLTFKCGNSTDLAKQILLLIENKELRQALGKKARESLLSQYSSSLSDKYEAFYKQILS